MSYPSRRSIRLPDFDYTYSGAYFVTLVAQGRAERFSHILAGEVILNPAGEMLRDVWFGFSDRFPGIALDEFVIMPNHFHGIIIITDPVGAALVAARDPKAIQPGWPGENRAGINPAPTQYALGDIIGAYKSITTHEYILGVNRLNWHSFDRRLWQRNYYEHILRSEADLDRVRAYIHENPLRWDLDRENPAFQGLRS